MLVECNSCEALVDGQLMSEYEESYPDELVRVKYSFLKCPKCASAFLMSSFNYFDDYEGWSEPSRLYPPVDKDISKEIPNALRVIYGEARICFKAKAYTATALMCRKTLEGIANEKSIASSNLATSLNDMKNKGLIENRFYEWANALRISGNEAAHGVNSSVTRQDAKDILEFTHALLEYLYTFQEKFERFKKRQSDSKNAES